MKKQSVLLISSSGGHWVQLSKLVDALDDIEFDVATVDPTVAVGIGARRMFLIKDFNRDTPLSIISGFFTILFVVFRSRTTHIVTTGAAPGLAALALGRLLGRKTLWLDSIANAKKMSLSGRIAIRIANVTLTQWPEIAEMYRGVDYRGKVI